MESFMNGAMLIEGALLSFLLALWMTWLALRGLFWLMPVATRPAATCVVPPIRLVANRQRDAA
jgi:hypothetical protein